MRKLLNNVWILGLFISLAATAQNSKPRLRECVMEKDQQVQNSKKDERKTYKFKSFKHKELVVKAAYKDICFKLIDSNYPKEKLELEKKEFISLLKGKIEQEADS